MKLEGIEGMALEGHDAGKVAKREPVKIVELPPGGWVTVVGCPDFNFCFLQFTLRKATSGGGINMNEALVLKLVIKVRREEDGFRCHGCH